MPAHCRGSSGGPGSPHTRPVARGQPERRRPAGAGGPWPAGAAAAAAARPPVHHRAARRRPVRCDGALIHQARDGFGASLNLCDEEIGAEDEETRFRVAVVEYRALVGRPWDAGVAPLRGWDGEEGGLEGLREMLVARRGDGFRCLLDDVIETDAMERKQEKRPGLWTRTGMWWSGTRRGGFSCSSAGHSGCQALR